MNKFEVESRTGCFSPLKRQIVRQTITEYQLGIKITKYVILNGFFFFFNLPSISDLEALSKGLGSDLQYTETHPRHVM